MHARPHDWRTPSEERSSRERAAAAAPTTMSSATPHVYFRWRARADLRAGKHMHAHAFKGMQCNLQLGGLQSGDKEMVEEGKGMRKDFALGGEQAAVHHLVDAIATNTSSA